MLNREPSYRVISRKKEVTVGTLLTFASCNPFRTNFEDEPMMLEPEDVNTDELEYTGKKFLARYDVDTWEGEIVHGRNCLSSEFGFFAGLLFGSISTDQPDGVGAPNTYRHTIEFQEAITLPTASMWEQSPDLGQKAYAGIACSQLVLNVPKGPRANIAATLMSIGKIAGTSEDLAGTAELDTAEAYMRDAHTDLKVGGTYSETAGIGSVADGVSIKNKLADIGLTMGNAAAKNYGYGRGDANAAFADSFRKADLKGPGLVTLDTKIEPDDATELNYVLNETENVMELVMLGAVIEDVQVYTIRVIFPRTRVSRAPKGRDGSILTADMSIIPLKDTTGTDWPYLQLIVINKVPTLLT